MELINVNETTPGKNARMCTSDALMDPHIGGEGGSCDLYILDDYPCYWNIED